MALDSQPHSPGLLLLSILLAVFIVSPNKVNCRQAGSTMS